MPSGWCKLVWKVWDDKGFLKVGQGKGSGDVTFIYSNTYTWIHAEVSVMYVGALWIVQDKARVDIYVAN